MSKELWFQTFESMYNAACDEGVAPDRAYRQATAKCDAAYRERLADQADHARLLRKEGR